MSGFQLLAPIGLTALAALPLVVLYHMRHTTPEKKPVPTLRFWLMAVEQQTEKTRFRRPPLSLLLLLHLLVVGLLAFALARPAATSAWAGLGRRTEPKHLIVLLDGSTSMVAKDTADGRTRFDVARDMAVQQVNDLHEGDVATVIVLGTHSITLEATDASSLKALHDHLSTISQPGGRTDLNAALRLARDLVLPGMDDRIVVLSDGAVSADPSLVKTVGAAIDFQHIGQPDDANLAVTDISSRAVVDDPGRQAVYARIVNFSDREVTTTVKVTGDEIELKSDTVTIAANADYEEVVDNIAAGTGNVTVTATSDDPLQADNSASLILNQESSLGLHILLVSDAQDKLQRALAVLRGGQLTTQSTTENLSSEPNAGNAYDLIVYEGFTPPPTGLPNVPMLFVNPPLDSPLLPAQGMMTTPTVDAIRSQDPLLQGVELAGVTVGETPNHVLTGTDTAIVSSADGPLLYRTTLAATGQTAIVIAFDVSQSNLTQRVAFPILMVNIAAELAPSPLPSAAQLGDPLRYRPRADAVTVRITPPESDSIDLPVASTAGSSQDDATRTNAGPREIDYADTGRSGSYTIEELDAKGSSIGSGILIVNAGHPRESDLRADPQLQDVLASASGAVETSRLRTVSDLWPAIVAVAILFLLLEWLWTMVPRRWRRNRTFVSTQSSKSPS